jgi:capsular exopolysaccharide synthesis family protein
MFNKEGKNLPPVPTQESPNIYYGGAPTMYGASYGQGDEYYGENNEEAGPFGDISLIRILRLIRVKWFTLVLGGIFGICCAVFYLTKTSPVYQASALIEMKVRKPKILSQQGAVLDDSRYVPRSEIFNTRLAKFQGVRMREIAAEKFALLADDKTLTKDDCIKAVSGNVSFKLRSKTPLVTISFQNTDKETTAIVANAYAMASESIVFEENKTSSESAVAWLKTQAEVHKKLLAEAEKELSDFKTKNNIDVLEGQKKSDEDTIAELNTTLAGLESKAVVLAEILKLMDVQTVDVAGAATLPSEIPHGEQILEALNQWQAAVRERKLLLRSYTEKHPKVIAINVRADSLEKSLLDELSTARAAVENNVGLLKKQSASLRDKIAVIRARVAAQESTIVVFRSQISSMERERDVSDVTYRNILRRIEEARLSADENTAIVKIIDLAKKPSSPIRPKKLVVLVMGVIMGMFAGFVLAFITDTIEDHVTSYTDIERLLGLKVIGLLPHVTKAERENLALTSLDSKFGAVSEAMAGIRTVLGAPGYKELTDSILITSSVPSEGKTVIASNLAIVSAKSGAKTLLIDFDMRRPKLAGIFGDPGKEHSLLHILNAGDSSKFSELPQSGKCDGLSVVTSSPSGKISPAEILGGRYVEEFLTWAKENYDRVIIDSPPFGIVGDAGVLACMVNSVILVCRPEQSRRRGMRHVVNQLNDVGANIIGVIINDIDFTKQGYFSNYYHYSYHNYQYSKYYRTEEK